MTYIEKTSHIEVAPAGQTITSKNIDNLFENDKYIYPYLLYRLNMFKK